MLKHESLIALTRATAWVACAIAAPVVQANDTAPNETIVEAQSLPAAIMSRIEERFPDGKIEQVSVVRDTYYEVELESGSREIEISFYPDGSKREGDNGRGRGFGGGLDEQVAFENLPKAVQETIMESLFLTGVDLVERDEQEGIVYYKAVYQGEEGQSQIRVTEAGDIIDRRSSILTDSLPAAIVNRVEKEFSDAKFTDATEFQETYYKVSIKNDSEEVEVAYLADGSVADTNQ